jgi:hypothetical protein
VTKNGAARQGTIVSANLRCFRDITPFALNYLVPHYYIDASRGCFPDQLPQLGQGIGEAISVFKKAIREEDKKRRFRKLCAPVVSGAGRI